MSHNVSLRCSNCGHCVRGVRTAFKFACVHHCLLYRSMQPRDPNPASVFTVAGPAATEQRPHSAAKSQDARGQGAVVSGPAASGRKVGFCRAVGACTFALSIACSSSCNHAAIGSNSMLMLLFIALAVTRFHAWAEGWGALP